VNGCCGGIFSFPFEYLRDVKDLRSCIIPTLTYVRIISIASSCLYAVGIFCGMLIFATDAATASAPIYLKISIIIRDNNVFIQMSKSYEICSVRVLSAFNACMIDGVATLYHLLFIIQ
jgi:hypothetical protein